MPAGKWSFTIEQGVDFDRTITYYVNKQPFDLSGYATTMQIRSAPSGTVYSTLSTANGRVTLGAATGTLRFRLTSAETLALNWAGRAYHDVVIDPGGSPSQILEGRVTLDPSTTGSAVPERTATLTGVASIQAKGQRIHLRRVAVATSGAISVFGHKGGLITRAAALSAASASASRGVIAYEWSEPDTESTF